MAHALGIDVEEWYHICGLNLPAGLDDRYQSRIVGNTKTMLDLLDALQTKATFFVLGAIAERFPELVEEIDRRGHEVASHGYSHLEIYKQTPDYFRADIRKSLEILRGIIPKKVIGYRAPDFSIVRDTLWAIDILTQEGIRYDCSIFPVRHPRYGIPAAPRFHYRIREDLVEFPPSTIRVLGENFPVAGGAYFRILPYSITKKMVETLAGQGAAVHSYLHVWEIDAVQPRIRLPIGRRLSHYAGIGSVRKKFEQLLSDFQYGPVYDTIVQGRY